MENLNNSNKIKIDVREIVFCNKKEKSFCDAFVYEPENIEEHALGNLYIIGEVINLPENSSYLINLLASIIKKEFYSKPKRSSLESLEASLHKANSTLSDFAEQGNIEWVGNLNMVCGSFKNRELHLSKAGNIRTLLVRNGQITDIGKNVSTGDKNHPFQTFVNIASGELETNDLVLFATSEFFNIFSLEKIRQLISSFDNIDDLAETIQDSIEQEDNVNSVGLLIIKVEKETKEKEKLPHVEMPVVQETKEKEVVYSLQEKSENTEKDTFDSREKVSLESIIKEYEKIGKEKVEVTQKETNKRLEGKLKVGVPEQDEEEKEHALSLASEESSFQAKTLVKNLSENLFAALKNVKNKIISLALPIIEKTVNKLEKIAHRSGQEKAKTETIKRIELISNKNKIFLVAFVLIFLLLAGNLIFTGYKNKKKEEFNFYNNFLYQAKEKLNQAEEAFIYNDSNQARIFLKDAKNLASEVKDSYKNLNDNATALLNEIQNNLDMVDFVNRIESPEIAFDLNQIEGMTNPKQIVKVGNQYYVSASANNLYQIDLKGKKGDDLGARSNRFSNFGLSASIEKTGEVIFLTGSNEVAIFNISSKEWSAKSIKYSSGFLNAKDIASYSNYLYILDPNSSQIYKHQRVLSGFGEGNPWIRDTETNLEDTISIAIDGYIYTLKADGAISKYLRGEKRDFSAEKPSDPISNPTKIYTRADLEYLYVVDSPKRRIVLFNKANGKLVKQYSSKYFDNLKDIIVDNKEEKIYILNGKKIFEVEIEK
jgi:serine/threonine protein phosphatase PrpC